MPAKELLPLLRSEDLDDPGSLVDGVRDTMPFPPELAEGDHLYPEPSTDPFDLLPRSPKVPSELLGIDTRNVPVIHNAFWVAGKVPSLNDLLEARGAIKPRSGLGILTRPLSKSKGWQARHCLYNEIKQDWKQRTVRAVGSPFVRVERAHFGYLVVEETFKRDPSNFCSAAIKFIEDGLVEAGVMPNDGWKEVLGIRMHWVHRKEHEPGVYVVMSDAPLTEVQLVIEYEEHLLNSHF